MKIRNGFVSNSSSSSFIIDADKYTISQIKEVIRKLVETNNLLEKDTITLNEICKISEAKISDFYDEVQDFYGKYHKNEYYPKNDSDKGIRVDSTYDNSIPWFIQNALENIALYRAHWG